MALTAACSLWLTPYSFRETYRVINELSSGQITAQIQPRVFQEQFPGAVLYVADVVPGPVERWRTVFIADDRPPGSRSGGLQREAEGPAITLAEEAIAITDVKNNRVQLHMVGASMYEAGKNPAEYVVSAAPVTDQVLQATRPGKREGRPFPQMDTGPLWREARKSRDAAIELHQRFALPFACVLLALVGIPLGVSSRKSGRSAAFVVTVALRLFLLRGPYQPYRPGGAGRAARLAGCLDAEYGPCRRRRGHARASRGSRRSRRCRPREIAVRERLAPASPAGAENDVRSPAQRPPEAAAAGAAATRGHLRPLKLFVLFRAAAGELRRDGAGVHVFRADGRHSQERDTNVARRGLPVLPSHRSWPTIRLRSAFSSPSWLRSAFCRRTTR